MCAQDFARASDETDRLSGRSQSEISQAADWYEARREGLGRPFYIHSKQRSRSFYTIRKSIRSSSAKRGALSVRFLSQHASTHIVIRSFGNSAWVLRVSAAEVPPLSRNTTVVESHPLFTHLGSNSIVVNDRRPEYLRHVRDFRKTLPLE